MARFNKVASLAYSCFRTKANYNWIRVDRKDNYIGVVTCKCGDTVTEIIYNSRKRSAQILTFDKTHIEEDRFSTLLKNLGIKSTIEVYNHPTEWEGLISPLLVGLMPHSPSGRVDNEQFKLILEQSENR